MNYGCDQQHMVKCRVESVLRALILVKSACSTDRETLQLLGLVNPIAIPPLRTRHALKERVTSPKSVYVGGYQSERGKLLLQR